MDGWRSIVFYHPPPARRDGRAWAGRVHRLQAFEARDERAVCHIHEVQPVLGTEPAVSCALLGGARLGNRCSRCEGGCEESWRNIYDRSHWFASYAVRRGGSGGELHASLADAKRWLREQVRAELAAQEARPAGG